VRADLTIAVDVATRTICAAALRFVGAVNAAANFVLAFQLMQLYRCDYS